MRGAGGWKLGSDASPGLIRRYLELDQRRQLRKFQGAVQGGLSCFRVYTNV